LPITIDWQVRIAQLQSEADRYIRAHLAQVGRTHTLFSDDAVRVIPRRVRGTHQRLPATALLAACTENKTIADE
jgi:type II secretory pathway predicted ATPase ExeA